MGRTIQMKKTFVKMIWMVLTVSCLLLAYVYYFRYQEAVRQQAEECAVDLINMIRLRQSIPLGTDKVSYEADILIFEKLVQAELYWPNYKIEMRNSLAKRFVRLKQVWLLEPPQQVTNQSLDFVSDVCKMDLHCPTGELNSR